MKKEYTPGGCRCCACFLYLNYFPDYAGGLTKNWSDDYTDLGAGGSDKHYRSDFTLPSSHFEINAGAFLDEAFFSSETMGAGVDSSTKLTIKLVDPTTPTTENLVLEIYVRDDGWTYYTTAGGLTIAYRNLSTIVEETSALQGETVVIAREFVDNRSTSLTGPSLAAWKSGLESESYTPSQDAVLPTIEVRETHVSVLPNVAVWAAKDSDIDYTDFNSIRASFGEHRMAAVPLYTGAISASKLQLEITNNTGSFDGEIMLAQGLGDPIGSTNPTCPQRNCRFIDDYHNQEWDLNNLVITCDNVTVTEENTEAISNRADYFYSANSQDVNACNESWTPNPSGPVSDEFRTITDIGAQEGFPHTVTGTLVVTPVATVQVIADEYSDASVTTGKVKMRVTLSFQYDRPTFFPQSVDDYLDYDIQTNNQLSRISSFAISPTLTWEYEEDRWSGNSRPSISLNAADANEYSGSSDDFDNTQASSADPLQFGFTVSGITGVDSFDLVTNFSTNGLSDASDTSASIQAPSGESFTLWSLGELAASTTIQVSRTVSPASVSNPNGSWILSIDDNNGFSVTHESPYSTLTINDLDSTLDFYVLKECVVDQTSFFYLLEYETVKCNMGTVTLNLA